VTCEAAATRPAAHADPHLGAYRLLAGLVDDALELTEDLRADSVDPIVHATAEALTATRALLALAAAPVPFPPHPPDRRDKVLRDALDSIRAAATAIRFALIEEGDRRRSSRSHSPGSTTAAGNRREGC